MKKVFKSRISIILIVTVLLSSISMFVCAEEDTSKVQDKTLATFAEKIIKNIDFFSRYPNVTAESLYKVGFETLLQEDPEAYEKAMKAILESVDEHSVYFNPDEAEVFLSTLNEEVVGIGVNVLSNDGNLIVSQPIPGTPAERAGILAGDIIIGADDKDLRGMDMDTAVNHIRGKAGTTVKIKILRTGISEPLTFNIKRELVKVETVDYEFLENNGKNIIKIDIFSFSNDTAKEFKAALSEADKKGIKNVIIDVRDNGGGYLDTAVEIADIFLPKDAVITTEDHKLEILNKIYKASATTKKYNVAILVNEMSASASEVLTAALCENNAAKSVGVKTFGKGTVQTAAMTGDGGMIKYTTAYYLTPEGNNIDKVGITPDVFVENSAKPMDMSEFDMFSLSKKYKLGDKGEEVRLAKKMLKVAGIFIGEENDVYDENLKIAVATYQKVRGLFSYGVLDITTQMNLYDFLKTAEVEVDDQLQAALDIF